MLTVACAVAVLVAVGANQGFAQEEGSGVDHTPYWYVVSHEVYPTKNHEYSLTMYEIVEALKRHEGTSTSSAWRMRVISKAGQSRTRPLRKRWASRRRRS
jgi:hypothetical protein